MTRATRPAICGLAWRTSHSARSRWPIMAAAVAEQRRERPGGGRVPAVKQTGLAEQECADAGGGQTDAAVMPGAQMRQRLLDILAAQRPDQAVRLLGVQRRYDAPIGLPDRGGRLDRGGHAERSADAPPHAHQL